MQKGQYATSRKQIYTQWASTNKRRNPRQKRGIHWRKKPIKKKKTNRLSFLCSARRSLVAVTTSLRFKRCAQPLGTNDILLCVGLQRHFGASPQSYNKTNREESQYLDQLSQWSVDSLLSIIFLSAPEQQLVDWQTSQSQLTSKFQHFLDYILH